MPLNYKRLSTLADYLTGVGKFEGNGVLKEKFDLVTWMTPTNKLSWRHFKIKAAPNKKPFKTKFSKKYGVTAVVPVFCQTAGCAIGWAATLPEFNKEGLFLIHDGIFAYPTFITNVDGMQISLIEFDAVREFFGLTRDQVVMLFVYSSYSEKDGRDPKAVARRIRSLLLCGDNPEKLKSWERRARKVEMKRLGHL